MKIIIYYDNIKFRLQGSKNVLKLIEKVIRNEKRIPGDLFFIFTDDSELIKINREFLDHDFYTDVIAFSNNEENNIGGEIYISIDTVKRNAHNYKISLKNEIIRVMIHGTLHLCGYNDGTEEGRNIMREREDKWMLLFR